MNGFFSLQSSVYLPSLFQLHCWPLQQSDGWKFELFRMAFHPRRNLWAGIDSAAAAVAAAVKTVPLFCYLFASSVVPVLVQWGGEEADEDRLRGSMSWRDVGMHASHARPLRVTVTAFSVSIPLHRTKPIPLCKNVTVIADYLLLWIYTYKSPILLLKNKRKNTPLAFLSTL